jgi:hypothetical protein
MNQWVTLQITIRSTGYKIVMTDLEHELAHATYYPPVPTPEDNSSEYEFKFKSRNGTGT